METPRLIVEITFAATPFYPDNWIPVTDYVLEEGTDIQRGRTDELEAMGTGTATVTLRNTDRRFDPDNASSPYYPNVRPNQRIRISAEWDGDTYILFTGYIRSWQANRRAFGFATTTIRCVDAFGSALAKARFESVAPIVQDEPFQYVSLVTEYVDVFTGDVVSGNPGENPPFTAINIATFYVNGGTFRIALDGVYTPAIPHTATIAQVFAALRTIPAFADTFFYIRRVGGNTSLTQLFCTNPNYSATGNPIWIGDPYTGIDLSGRITVDLSSLTTSTTPPFGQPSYNLTAPYAAAIPGVLASVAGRPLELSTSGTITGSVEVKISGLLYGTSAVSTVAYTLNSGTPSLTTTDTWDTIYRVYMKKSNNAANTSVLLTVEAGEAIIDSGLSGAQIERIARLAGVRAYDLDLDTGVSTLLAPTATGSQPLSLIQSIANAEGGVVFMSADGYLVFKDRRSVYGGLSQATFSPNTSTNYPYEDVTPVYDDQAVRNVVSVTAEGGDPQIAQNLDSIDRYYIQTLDEGTLPLTTDAEALDRARFKVALYAEPATRLPTMVHRGDLAPTTLWPLLFGAELSNKYVVEYDPMPGTTVSKGVTLEQITYAIRRGDWLVTWALSLRASVFTADVSIADGPDIALY